MPWKHSAALSRRAHRACTLVYPVPSFRSVPFSPSSLRSRNKRIRSSLYITPDRLYRFDKQRQRIRAGSQEFTTHAATGCPGETDNGI